MVKRLKRGLVPASEIEPNWPFDRSSVANGERRTTSRRSRLIDATFEISTALSVVCGPSDTVPARLIFDAVTTMSPVEATSIGRSKGEPTSRKMSVTVELPAVDATATVYGPPERRPDTVKLPEASVVARLTVPEGTLVIVTWALATGVPALCTEPRISAVVSCA